MVVPEEHNMKSSKSHSSNVTLFRHLKYEHLVAGITGGVTSTLLLHPLDLLKIRFAGKRFYAQVTLLLITILRYFY